MANATITAAAAVRIVKSPPSSLTMDDAGLPQRSTSKRLSRMTPISINTAAALTDQRSPTSSRHSSESLGGRSSCQSHSRTMSFATDAAGPMPRSNRFSLPFPVQVPDTRSPTRPSTSPTRDASAMIPEALVTPIAPTDTTILTAIATQERRVMELKEELHRAEVDLSQLKRQWAQHEAQKKRNEAKQVTKLQTLPMFTDLPDDCENDDRDGSNTWMQHEMERRKALMNNPRCSSRTVFKGSRHTRTLSLLSPVMAVPSVAGTPTPRQPLLPRKESLRAHAESAPLDRKPRPALLSRSSTTGDLTAQVANHATAAINLQDTSLDHELLLRTGKKMATDLKDGLWTFFEDLRQATVGEDATVIPPPHLRRQSSAQTVLMAKKQGSRSSLRPTSRGSSVGSRSGNGAARRPAPAREPTHAKKSSQTPLPDLADPSFWTEHGIGQTSPNLVTKKSSARRLRDTNPSPKAPSVASSDAWDTWDCDSPRAAKSEPNSRSSSAASEATTLPSTVSGSDSPRTSTEKDGRKNPIPWPALSKMGPATLRRTASHLMAEWEKSLTPDPGTEYTGQDDYLSMGVNATGGDAVIAKKDGEWRRGRAEKTD